MRPRLRSRSLTAAVILPLAVILALPEMRWCQIAWADLAECLAACPTPVACSATACEAAGAGTALPCGAPTACGATAPHRASDVCPARSVARARDSEGSADSRERVWCPATARPGTRPDLPDLDARLEALSSPIPIDLTVEPGPGTWRGHAAEAVAIPPDSSPHAPPPIRAPPGPLNLDASGRLA
jgi:hypothetical protein